MSYTSSRLLVDKRKYSRVWTRLKLVALSDGSQIMSNKPKSTQHTPIHHFCFRLLPMRESRNILIAVFFAALIRIYLPTFVEKTTLFKKLDRCGECVYLLEISFSDILKRQMIKPPRLMSITHHMCSQHQPIKNCRISFCVLHLLGVCHMG